MYNFHLISVLFNPSSIPILTLNHASLSHLLRSHDRAFPHLPTLQVRTLRPWTRAMGTYLRSHKHLRYCWEEKLGKRNVCLPNHVALAEILFQLPKVVKTLGLLFFSSMIDTKKSKMSWIIFIMNWNSGKFTKNYLRAYTIIGKAVYDRCSLKMS